MIEYITQETAQIPWKNRRQIEKKILPEYYKGIRTHKKMFEIRKDEDGIKPGDILVLREWDGENYTGSKTRREVTAVLRNCPEYGLEEGYCILSLQVPGWDHISPAVLDEHAKTCETCVYHHYEPIVDGWVCVNTESEHFVDWTENEDSCEKWEPFSPYENGPWKAVYDELSKMDLFMGKYDAVNGNEHFMYGIGLVMDVIADRAGCYEEHEEIWLNNLIQSEERGKCSADG